MLGAKNLYRMMTHLPDKGRIGRSSLLPELVKMDVIIAGAGGHGRVVLDILRAAGTHRVVGFLDANQDLHGTEIAGLPVLGHLNLLPKLKGKGVGGAIVAI